MIILTTDPHFTDRPKDAYRLDLFRWLSKMIDKYKADTIIFLGDMTVFKDNHSSKLVNSLVAGLEMLSQKAEVIIIKGNHDFMDIDLPFFYFLNAIPNIVFISSPCMRKVGGVDMLFLPHTKDISEWDMYIHMRHKPVYAFAHQTANQALASNGYLLDGISLDIFEALAEVVFAGDIHVPQELGNVIHIGSPYTINFNDTFEPRCMVLDEVDDTIEDIYFPCLRRWKLKIRDASEILNNKDLHKGDQVMVEIELPREELPDWIKHRKAIVTACKKKELEVFGIELHAQKKRARVRVDKQDSEPSLVTKTPAEIVMGYCRSNSLPSRVRKMGIALLDDA